MLHNIKKLDIGKRKRAVVIAVVFVLIAALAVVFAKYVFQKSDTKETGSSEMYLTSDLLSESGNSYTLAPGTDAIQIELRNYADSLRWSEEDIQYSYTVAQKGSDAKRTGTGVISRKSEEGTNKTLTIDSLQAGTYDVTVTSTAPFRKVLKGSFTIPQESAGIHYSVSDSEGSPYALLTVSTDQYSGNVTVSWPQGMIPDSTQDAFAGIVTRSGSSYAAGTVTVSVKAYSSYTYRFFKEDVTQDYSTSQTIKAVAAK